MIENGDLFGCQIFHCVPGQILSLILVIGISNENIIQFVFRRSCPDTDIPIGRDQGDLIFRAEVPRCMQDRCPKESTNGKNFAFHLLKIGQSASRIVSIVLEYDLNLPAVDAPLVIDVIGPCLATEPRNSPQGCGAGKGCGPADHHLGV